VSTAPADFDLRMLYAIVLRDQRKFPEAAREFTAAAAIKQDSVEAWTELAGVLLLAEQLPQGLAALDHVSALGKETSGHFYIRAMTLDKLQKRKEAGRILRQVSGGQSGQNPDQVFHARQRILILERELGKR
jgi:tetratricopeptide (TPR) repeat protein